MSARTTLRDVVVVIPCYNEARRLDAAEVGAITAAGPRVLLVNDGSTDATLAVLEQIAATHDGVDVLDLGVNGGKGEAVRRGLAAALESGGAIVGFADADMSTPPHELVRLASVLCDDPSMDVVLGSRVSLLGRSVDRSVIRHYSGRVFATAAGAVLGLRVYDTQCGAKFFRSVPGVRVALSEPFHSRWSFDVELIGRLVSGRSALETTRFVEVPLQEWHDVAGSKLTLGGSLRSGLELVSIARALRRWRAQVA
ncbi:MAG: hypothetical protein RI958_1685 [Actinomycetota bacterium]|jgi:glycosyltransferase involved in cell wall biosynthesis